MEAVGYDMYLKLLSEEISRQKGEEVPEQDECMIDVPVEAHIPDSYIESMAMRIDIYKKIAAISDKEDASDLIDELCDRFGEPPVSVMGLIDVSLIRGRASALGVSEISQRSDSVLLYCRKLTPALSAGLAQSLKGRIMINASSRPYVSLKPQKGKGLIFTINEALDALEKVLPEPGRKEDAEGGT